MEAGSQRRSIKAHPAEVPGSLRALTGSSSHARRKVGFAVRLCGRSALLLHFVNAFREK